MNGWTKISADAVIEQNLSWWRSERWWHAFCYFFCFTTDPPPTEPRRFWASAYIKEGPAELLIIDQGPDKRPGLRVVPTSPRHVVAAHLKLVDLT